MYKHVTGYQNICIHDRDSCKYAWFNDRVMITVVFLLSLLFLGVEHRYHIILYFACSLRYWYVVSMTTRCSGWEQWAVSQPQVIGGTERSWGLSCDDCLLPSATGHRTSGKYSDRAWIISLRSKSDAVLLVLQTGSTTIIAFVYINKHNYVWMRLP